MTSFDSSIYLQCFLYQLHIDVRRNDTDTISDKMRNRKLEHNVQYYMINWKIWHRISRYAPVFCIASLYWFQVWKKLSLVYKIIFLQKGANLTILWWVMNNDSCTRTNFVHNNEFHPHDMMMFHYILWKTCLTNTSMYTYTFRGTA